MGRGIRFDNDETDRWSRCTFAEHQGLTGRLRFGVGELSALTWLPRFIAAVQRQHGQLELEPHVDVDAALEDSSR